MSVKSYDKVDLFAGVLLDLPCLEGQGVTIHDISRARETHNLTAFGAPTWGNDAAANAAIINFDGAGDYLEATGANTADLDFTAGDYSMACWVNLTDTALSMMLMGRYVLDTSGWELYFFDTTVVGANGYLTLRHHHASLGADVRDGCYSTGWFEGSWYLLTLTRSGLYPVMYRNGVPLAMTYDVGGLKDPDASAQDLVLGARYTKNTDWLKGSFKSFRIWNRELSALECQQLFQQERALFGV